MPSKPAQYGIKIWTLCDVTTAYAWNMQPYLGKASPDASPEKQQGKQVVMYLTMGLSGNTLTTDNFFTSWALGMELLKERKLALVGTIRCNRPELPPQLLDLRQRRNLSSCFAFQKNMTAVSYVPKQGKNVILLSTKHRKAEVSEAEHQKPKIILDYNQCKGAVDTLDKLVGTYSCKRMTRRWPMALFSNMLDVSAYNALVLWLNVQPTWNQAKTFRRRLFLQELGMSLVNPLMARRERLPRTLGAADMVLEAQQCGDPGQTPAPAKAAAAHKKRCYLCRGKRSQCTRSCSKCRKAICKDHTVCLCTSCTT